MVYGKGYGRRPYRTDFDKVASNLSVHGLWTLIGNSCLKRSPYQPHWYPLAVRFGVLKQSPESFVSSHRVFSIRRGNNLFHILPVWGAKLLLDFIACSSSLFLLRRFSEGDTYGRPFLELVNLCGMDRLTPEVNSSRKLDHKSSIDRSQ